MLTRAALQNAKVQGLANTNNRLRICGADVYDCRGLRSSRGDDTVARRANVLRHAARRGLYFVVTLTCAASSLTRRRESGIPFRGLQHSAKWQARKRARFHNNRSNKFGISPSRCNEPSARPRCRKFSRCIFPGGLFIHSGNTTGAVIVT